MQKKKLLPLLLLAVLTGTTAISLSVHAAPQVQLNVDATKDIHPFTSEMLGVDYNNWSFSWGKPFLADVPGLTEATRELHPGIIRYAGGLWANSVGFDRTAQQRTPYTKWNYPGDSSDYWFHYSTNEIDNLASYSKAIGAEVMIQVNIRNNNPKMWADMVRYCNIEKSYNFKYWEIGNELDMTGDISADEYAKRLQSYQKAMLAVDPSIKIQGAATAGPIEQNDSNSVMKAFMKQPPAAARAAGQDLDALTYHWYQQCNTTKTEDVTRYAWYENGSPIDPQSWRNNYSRIWAQLIPPRVRTEALSNYPSVRQGITELNVDACNNANPLNGNQIAAVWFADVLGNLAYNGIDFVTMFQGFGAANEVYSLAYPDNENSPSRIFLRPTYSTYLLYAKYFGNELVQATTNDPDRVSIYASRDSRDPGTLKLMIANLSGDTITAPINLQGFTPTSGSLYQLKSNKPTDQSPNSATQSSSSAINGITLDGSHIADSINQIKPLSITTSGSTLSLEIPPYTANAIVLFGAGSNQTPLPAATPQTTPKLEDPTLPDNNKKPTNFYARDYQAKWVNQLQAATYEGSKNDGDEYFDVAQCSTVDFWAELQNTGTKPWVSSNHAQATTSNEVTFATYKDAKVKSAPLWTGYDACPGNANCGKSYFQDTSWVSQYRIGTLNKDLVLPGDTAKILMKFHIPCDAPAGRYREDISAASGNYWINNIINGDPLKVMHIWFGVDTK